MASQAVDEARNKQAIVDQTEDLDVAINPEHRSRTLQKVTLTTAIERVISSHCSFFLDLWARV